MFIDKLISSLFPFRNKERVTDPDPSFGFTEVNQAIIWMKQKEYDLVKQLFLSLKSDEKTALIEGLCMTETYAIHLRNWVTQQPECAVAQLLNGALCTHTAWVARTASRGKDVSAEQAGVFFQHLERAYDHLTKAIDLNPEEPEPFARMIRVLMGLSQPVELLYDYFDALLERDEQHLYGHMYLLNAISQKWLGSNEEMMNFASQVAERTPAGSLLHTLTPMAHIEIWLSQDQVEEQNRYFQQKQTQEAVYKSYQQSIANNQLVNSPLEPIIHNYFCFAFHWMKDSRLAQTERKSMGQQMTFSPWAYEGLLTLKEVDAYLK